MIETFTYRTQLGDKEFRHTVYAKDIESSLKKWIDLIISQRNEVFSFDSAIVEKIESEYASDKLILNHNTEIPFLAYRIDNVPQWTYIDKVNKGNPDFIAEVKYLTKEEGGRSHYAANGYRPHFQMYGKKEMTSAEQLFIDKDKVAPGEVVKAEIRILWVEAFEGLLERGTGFHLGEGSNIVANGIILEVLNERLRKNV